MLDFPDAQNLTTQLLRFLLLAQCDLARLMVAIGCRADAGSDSSQDYHSLPIIKRFDRIAAVDDAAPLDPAIKTRSVVQRPINRQVHRLFEILAGEIEPPAEEDGFAGTKASSGRDDSRGRRRECLQHLHLERSNLTEVGVCCDPPAALGGTREAELYGGKILL